MTALMLNFDLGRRRKKGRVERKKGRKRKQDMSDSNGNGTVSNRFSEKIFF